jgi:hypothetical protein
LQNANRHVQIEKWSFSPLVNFQFAFCTWQFAIIFPTYRLSGSAERRPPNFIPLIPNSSPLSPSLLRRNTPLVSPYQKMSGSADGS